MSEPSALERVRDVFTAVLGVPRDLVVPEATPEQVPGWDSLAHLSLVSEIEKAFGVSLTLDEVLAVSRVGDFVSLVSGSAPGGARSAQDRGDAADRMLPGERDALFEFANEVKDEITLVHSPAHWEWQYAGNPAAEPGRMPVYLLRQGGRIVGHLGTIPVSLEVDGVSVRAAWTAGLVAAPGVRARGGGVKLLDRWLSECDVGLVLGTTPDAEALFTQLRWLRPGDGHVRSYMRLLDADAVVRKRVAHPVARKAIASVANAALSLILRAPSRLGGDIGVRTFDRFDARFDDLWDRVRKGYRLIVRRDRRYLAWKFGSQPGVEYIRILAERGADQTGEDETRSGTLAGYAVLRVMKRKPYVGYIVDILAGAEDEEAWNHLVAASVDVLLARGVQQVWCVVLNPSAEAALRRFAFVLRESPMTFFVRPNAPGLDPALFADAANWFVTKGDADQDRP